FAARQSLADAMIAAMWADASSDEIAQAGQSGEGLRLSSQGDAEACHLDEAARQQRRLGVIAQAQTIIDAGGDADDIFERPCQLDADRIEIGIDAEMLGAEHLLNGA